MCVPTPGTSNCSTPIPTMSSRTKGMAGIFCLVHRNFGVERCQHTPPACGPWCQTNIGQRRWASPKTGYVHILNNTTNAAYPNAIAAALFASSFTSRYRWSISRLECPDMDWRTRNGTPLSLADVKADRLSECVLAPTTSRSEQAARSALSTAWRVMCFDSSLAFGNT